MDNRKIAIIDSGVGGLASIAACRLAMPSEEFIYFGDTAHVPYGSKTQEQIASYIEKITQFLKAQDVKMIIVACNTTSSFALPVISKNYPGVLVQGIIEPAVSQMSKLCGENNYIGVIATPVTAGSGAYEASVKKLKKKLNVYMQPCAKLVDLIEHGKTDCKETEDALHEYMDSFVKDNHLDTLVLGCTHYPLIRPCIERLYPGLTTIIDPSQALAASAYRLLKVHSMDAEFRIPEDVTLYASSLTEDFKMMAKRLGLEDCEMKEVSL